jgi:hypothetical protein
MFIKEPSSGPRDGKRIREPVAEALGGVMAKPVARRHISMNMVGWSVIIIVLR